MRDSFLEYHPVVNFLYFIFVIGTGMLMMHPIILGIGLCAAFCYRIMLEGWKKTLKQFLCFTLPVIMIVALVNPLFNHYGVTVLFYLQDGNAVTLESMLFSLVSALMLCEIIQWFQCYNAVMTSDKFIWLFGRILPALSLILSMCLRFVPCFQSRMTVIQNGQKCIGRSTENGNVFQKIRHGITSFSILVTWSLENAVETADSMKARGYGLKGRTAFSIYSITKRDLKALTIMGILSVLFFTGVAKGCTFMQYNPKLIMNGLPLTAWGVITYGSYAIFCILPILFSAVSEMQWRKQKKEIQEVERGDYRLWT